MRLFLAVLALTVGTGCLSIVTIGDFKTTGTSGGRSTGAGTGGSTTTSGTTTGTSPIAVGPCTGDAQCVSGVCGVDGAGNCCKIACGNTTPPCGATDCDARTGACVFPGSSVTCGVLGCDGDSMSGAGICNGEGACSVQTVPCGSGFCDPTGPACCSMPTGPLKVDSVTGTDGPCCGLDRAPCRTLTRAMQLIDGAQATGTTIVATVDGGGGDWGTAETYPVVLGWSVALVAPGVYFDDEGGNPELFDIASPQQPDGGSVTISGSDEEDVWVGVSQAGIHSTDPTTIKIENEDALSIFEATVASSMTSKTTALTVVGDARLLLGLYDPPTPHTVTIGNDSAGWNGIVCTPVDGGGCSVASLGDTTTVIQGQQNVDIDAEDGSEMSLSDITIGFPPTAAGFGECPAKPDTGSSKGPAVLLHGSATAEFDQAVVQCIEGTGIALQASQNGTPTLTLSGVTIQNTGIGIHAIDGTAEILYSTIEFNAVGIWADQSPFSPALSGLGASIDLSGQNLFSPKECTVGDYGGNTVACNFGAEIGLSGGGVSVRNTSDNILNACGVFWDTPSPDLFMCNSRFNNCKCEVASCASAGGSDENMDAVYTSDPIITASNQLASLNCGAP